MRVFGSFVIKEVARFLEVPIQTLFTPLVSAVLYILIFGLTMGSRISFPYDVSYLSYLTSGLIIMHVLLQAFQNSTSSMIISKYRLNIVDTLTYPIARPFLIVGLGIAGMTRGLIVGCMIWVMGLFFIDELAHTVWLFLISASLGGLLFALMGAWLGLVCRTFDQISIYTNFIVTPILYLSGVFFPMALMSEPWKTLSKYNPVIYLVETARYGLIGTSEVHLLTFFLFTPLGILVVWWGATRSLKKGVALR